MAARANAESAVIVSRGTAAKFATPGPQGSLRLVDQPRSSGRVGEGGDGRRPPWSASCLDTDDRRQAGIALVAGMRSGAILDRSGKPYKPKTVRGYEHSLHTYIYPLLGSRKVSSLRRVDIQGFVEEMRALGAAPSTVHNRLDRCG